MTKIERFRGHHFQDATAKSRSAGRVGGTAHDQEFLSAPAHQYIRLAYDGRKPLRNELQQPIAGRMSVAVIHLLKEIDVYHNENQVTMIELPNAAATGALVISQHLVRLSGEDLLEIATIPYARQYIGERNLLQFQILS